jgi:hypothetical protein
MVTINKGGTAEKKLHLTQIIIPDLWHIALAQSDKEAKEAILKTWHLAHDLKKHIEGNE